MDAAPVEVIVEARGVCVDLARARAVLDEALGSAAGPRRGAGGPNAEGEGPRWIVDVRLERDADLGRGEAVIRDDAGREVARRTVTERGRTCAALTRALGAWASLVLDQELSRARDDARPAPDTSASVPYRGTGYLLPVARDADRVPAEVPERAVELGALLVLRSGLVGATSVAGVSPYANVQTSPSIFLRPSLAIGWSTERTPTARGSSSYTTLGGRFDVCRRIPGNYIDRRGLELDLCAGGDLMMVVTNDDDSLSALRASLGPAANLRGELGGGFALELRGSLGVNLARAAMGPGGEAPLLASAGEVGISARLP